MNENTYDNVIKPVTSNYQELDTDLLINITTHLAKDRKTLENGLIDAWKQKRLIDVVALQNKDRNLIKDVPIPTISSDVIKELNGNEKEYVKAFKLGADIKPPVDITQSVIINVLDNADALLRTEMYTAKATMLKSANNVYINAINTVATDYIKGNITYDKAMRNVVKQISNGIPLIDKSGRKWGIDTYTNMLMRTTLQQATTDAQMIRADEWGADLIEVSSHADARPLCAEFQGKVYSRNVESAKYPRLSSTSYGKPAGLFGINCRHAWYPFFDGISEQTFTEYKKKDTDKNYKNSQIQRGIERDIRKIKREILLLENMDIDNNTERGKLLLKQKQMREFIDNTNRTRRSVRERIV